MKIALINNDAFSTLHFRAVLIKKLIELKHDVTVIIPDGQEASELRKLGAHVIIVPFYRFFSFQKDFSFFYILYKIFKREKFDLVHTMTIKPNIYGTFAAKLAKVPKIVSLISGAGYIFQETPSLKKKLLKPFILWLYARALHLSNKIWFQNSDDLREFQEKRLIRKGQGVVILSSGVNLEKFSSRAVSISSLKKLKSELKLTKEKKVILLVAARMIVTKGIKEFIFVARKMYEKFPDWRFILVAPDDPGTYDRIPEEFIEANKSPNLIIIRSFEHNINTFFELADIVTLPALVREGVPRVLLEALSFGKPVVTSNIIGCKETVKEGINGFLVPPGDVPKLQNALEVLMNDAQKRKTFGEASRNFAESTFADDIVAKKVLEELYGI